MKKRYVSVLTSVLVLIQSLCFSFNGFAWEQTNVEDLHAERAVKIINSLEINNYIPVEGSSVSRLQFVTTLMSLLAFNQLTPGGTSVFTDVKGEFSGILDYAANLKIVSKGEHFRPDAPITYAEALKMCLVATGYEYECAAKGGWPDGVMNVAYRLKLGQQINLCQNDILTSQDALSLLYNLMNIKVVNIDAVKKLNPDIDMSLSVGDDTIMSIYHGVYKLSGVVTENSRTSLYLSKKGEKSCIEINSQVYYCEEDIEDLIGHNVEAFVLEEKDEVVAAFSEKNTVRVISGDTVLNFQNGKIDYEENGKKKSISVEGDYDVLYNGKAYSGNLNTEFLEGCEYIHMIDNDRDNRFEVLSLLNVSYTLVEKVNYVDKIIYTHSQLGSNINVSDEKGQYIFINKDGERTDLYHIEPDMLLEVVVSADGLFAKVKESDKVITGKITATDYDNLLLAIDGTEYEITDDFKSAFSHLSVGTKGNFYISTDEKVVMYQKSSSRLQYGYIVKTGKKSLNKYQVKMLCENGKIEILDFADKIIVDTHKKDAEDVYSDINNGLFESNLIRFRTDDEGKLKVLDTAESDERTGNNAIGTLNDDSRDVDDSLILYDFTADDSFTNYFYKTVPKSLFPKVSLAGAKVFVVPNNPAFLDDESKYRVGNSDLFSNDQEISRSAVEIFDVDKYGNCSAMLYKGDVVKTEFKNSSFQSAVIEQIRYERDEDDNFTKKLYFIVNGAYESYFLDETVNEASLKTSGEELCVGDIVRYKADGDTLYEIVVDFDATISVMAPNSSSYTAPFNGTNASYHYQSGKLYSINDKVAYFTPEAILTDPINEREYNFSWSTLRNFSISKDRIVKVTVHYSSESGTLQDDWREVTIADLSEVETYLEKGIDADYAVLRQNALEGRVLVVYKFVP